jgi:hypothetical protein
LQHAYGPATDVPGLLRQLLDSDRKVRSETLETLYGNIFHQGTRFPATPYAIPFLIELCESERVSDRIDILSYWSSLIAGYFSIQERPLWSDGKRIHWGDQVDKTAPRDECTRALHRIYRESVKGHALLCRLLQDQEPTTRMGAARVLACMPTLSGMSLPVLREQFQSEPSAFARAAIAFALGELGDAAALKEILARESAPAPRCMAACELARLQPEPELLQPLLHFVSEPVDSYDGIPGAGGKSTGDAAFSIALLPRALQQEAIPAVIDLLGRTRSFDTIPLVMTLLSAAFSPTDRPVMKLDSLQRIVLTALVQNEELWSIGNLYETFQSYGLTNDRNKMATLLGVKVVEDPALAALRSGLSFAEINFLAKARERIEQALAIDSMVLERASASDECWFLVAKSFAETDAARAIAAYKRAIAKNSTLRDRIDPTWRLATLVDSLPEG